MSPVFLILMLGWVAVIVWRNVLQQQDADPVLDRDRKPFRRRMDAQQTGSSTRPLRSFLPRSRKPFMPAADRAPLPGRISFSSIEDYIADGMKGVTILLMQADRRRSQS